MRLAFPALILAGLAVVTVAASHPRALPPGSVVVDHVPPDACGAYWGFGPCREHGHTIIGSTDAVAGPPPASWRGKIEAPGVRP